MKKKIKRRYADNFEFVPIGFFTLGSEGRILEVNPTAARLLGAERSGLINEKLAKFIVDDFQTGFQQHCKKVLESGTRETYDLQLLKSNRSVFWAQLESIAVVAGDNSLNGRQVNIAITDITDRKKAEDALCKALDRSHEQAREVTALLEGSRAVLQYRDFKDSAKSIFNSCKNLIGARAGYVALLTPDGSENDLLHLDAGGLSCTVNPALPMPIRGLRERAYRSCKTVFDNRFSKSRWVDFLPDGHVILENVLFAPLVIKGMAVGLLGLANKPGGFSEHDARIAAGFSEFASVALFNSRTLESLGHSEERFRSVVETAIDAITTVDSNGRIIFWNQKAEVMFGYKAAEVIGQPVAMIMPERFREAHQRGLKKAAACKKPKITGHILELVGLRKDTSEFPLELSLANWETKEGIFFTAIVRDISERKQAEKELTAARDKLEHRVNERTAELAKTNTRLRKQISECEMARLALRESDKELRVLSNQLLSAEEKERKRIARELHDGIGQALSAIKFSVENALLKLRAAANPVDLGALEAVIPLTQKTIEEVRRIVKDLRPSILDDLGILATIRWFCREFQNVYSAIRIETTIGIKENEVSPYLKTTIYRIMQEALNNVAKHSRASFVHLQLKKSENHLSLSIHDNGRGFDLDKALALSPSCRGFGLASMRERAEISGATFEIHSTEKSGTTIRVVWQN